MRRTVFHLFLGIIVFTSVVRSETSRSQARPAKSASKNEAEFEPLKAWRAAILSGNAAALSALYSANPPATVGTPEGKSTDVAAEVNFWTSFKSDGPPAVEISEIQSQSPQADLRQVVFQTALTTRTNSALRKVYVSAALVWQKQGDAWRIVSSQRTAPARLLQPLSSKKDLYPAEENAHTRIKEALTRTASSHKRVLLVFGANWCYDCHVLDAAFHTAEIAPLLTRGFEVVHVDVGEYNKNLDLAERYEVPLKKGVPAIAVLTSDGKLLYAQKTGEFEATRRLGPEDIIAFLQRWKP